MRRWTSMLGVFLLALAVVGVQMAATAAGKAFYLTQLTMTAYSTMVVIGLSLVMGYAGQISLGHGAFFAIGGYASAALTTRDLGSLLPPAVVESLLRGGLLVARTDMYGGELVSCAPWLAFAVALGLTALVAAFIGFPALRLKGHYLAMGTLGFGLIVYRVFLGTEWLGGADGIVSVPPLRLFGVLEVAGGRALRLQNYYIAWGLMVVVVGLLVNLTGSRIGRALHSIHDSELAANAMGINTAAYKLKVFVLSAVLAAMAGSLMTHYNGGIAPTEAGVMRSVRYVTLVAAGGMASIWGALAVGSVLTFLSLRGVFGTLDHAVFGAILIGIMSFAPQGPLRPLGRLAKRGVGRLLRRSAAVDTRPGVGAAATRSEGGGR